MGKVRTKNFFIKATDILLIKKTSWDSIKILTKISQEN